MHLQVLLHIAQGVLEITLVRVAKDNAISAILPVEVCHHGEGDESDGRLQLRVLRVDQEDHASSPTLLS